MLFFVLKHIIYAGGLQYETEVWTAHACSAACGDCGRNDSKTACSGMGGGNRDLLTAQETGGTVDAQADTASAKPVPTIRLQNHGDPADWDPYGSFYDIVLKWTAMSDSTLIRYDIYRAVGENGTYQKIGTADAGANSFMESNVECYERTLYHYKIKAVYEGEVESPFSNVVSTGGMLYGDVADLDRNCVGARIVDNKGNPIDSLTIHVGETSPELHVQFLYKDGSKKDWKTVTKNGWLEWGTNSEEYFHLGTDRSDDKYVRYLPTTNYLDSVDHVKLVGVSPTNGVKHYVAVQFQSDKRGNLVIPVTVLPAEPGVDYGEAAQIRAYDDVDEMYAAIRNALRNREKAPQFFVTDEAVRKFNEELYGDEYANPFIIEEKFYEKVFDFYGERVGMLPTEGDYLDEGIKAFKYTLSPTTSYYNEYYCMVTFSPITYVTTRAQEDWMDAEIGKMLAPGGRFYEYVKEGNTKSDYDKIKAVYDYVATELGIKWVDGRQAMIYHSAYSALHDRKGSCQSWALLFTRLTRELGVPSRVLMGTDAGAHTYNIVRLNGRWYYVDCSNKRFLQGSKTFKTTRLQSRWLGKEFQNNYIKKISTADYGGSATSSIKSITALNDTQVNAVDANLLSTSAKMAAAYKVSGSTVTVKNASKKTLLPIYGCTNYLGGQNNSSAASQEGYYLAFRINVDSTKLAKDAENDNVGTLTISYNVDGERVSRQYTATDDSTLKMGYVDVILKLKDDEAPNITVAIDFDTDVDTDQAYSAYKEKVYTFNVSSLKKSGSARFGAVRELTNLTQSGGIETSSPRIKVEEAGQKVTAFYDAVAYSMNITLADTEGRGNYVALQVDAPESMKGTAKLKDTLVQRVINPSNGISIAYQLAEDRSYIRLYAPMKVNGAGSVGIGWAGSSPQTVTVKAAEGCRLESVNERAELPKSVKINGLVKTMYTGQSQTVDTTITRKYERDEVRLVFTSSDCNVISINRITGVMQALKPGSATITVTVTDGSGVPPKDKKGKILKGMTASAKVTVKAPTAPGSLKITEVKDTSVRVNWKANTTGQYMEIYAVPVNKTTMGKSKSNWKSAIEKALVDEGMNTKMLSSMTLQDKTQLCRNLESRLGVDADSVTLTYAASGGKSMDITGLQIAKGYAFYVRNIAENQVNSIYYTGAVVGETRTKTKVLDSIAVELMGSDGNAFDVYDTTEDGKPLFTIKNGVLSNGDISNDTTFGGQEKLVYSVQETGCTYTSVAYKSTNANVVKVDKKGKLILGKQAGTAELYTTGKDSAGKVRESERICIKVILQPNKLVNKTTTLTQGSSAKLRDLIGYSIKGSSTELQLEKIDFEAALQSLEAAADQTGAKCFVIERDDQNIGDSVVTAVGFLPDTKGRIKSGNSVKIPFSMYADQGQIGDGVSQPLSSASATIKVTTIAAPAISKVTARDTSITVKFRPSAGIKEYSNYTVAVTDRTTKQVVYGTGVNEQSDSTEKKPIYTCVINDLSAERNYSVQVVTRYSVTDGSGRLIERTSSAKSIKTLKPLLIDTANSTLGINYISLPDLRASSTALGSPAAGKDVDSSVPIVLKNNETYVFMAQVNNLNRVTGTDKLKWTISSGTKNIAKVKMTKDTYQTQISTMRTGTFTVKVTSTVSKEVLATFTVTVVPYQE